MQEVTKLALDKIKANPDLWDVSKNPYFWINYAIAVLKSVVDCLSFEDNSDEIGEIEQFLYLVGELANHTASVNFDYDNDRTAWPRAKAEEKQEVK